jgi:hypothetical protein
LLLLVRWHGAAAKALGATREWYVPRSGLYHVLQTASGKTYESVYDGRSITTRGENGLSVTRGDAAFLSFIASRHDIFESPGIVVARAYLSGHRHEEGSSISSEDGGHTIDFDFHYVDEGVNTHLRGTVTVAKREAVTDKVIATAFRPLSGTPVAELLQLPPGTPPQFGEDAYWFGSELGAAHAATALEEHGPDPTEPASNVAQPDEYRTIYRMPVAALPGGLPPLNTDNYPGLGDMADTDISVDCRASPEGYIPGVSPSLADRFETHLDDGSRATVYISPYQQGEAQGVSAAVVVGGTTCAVHGLISEKELRAALGRFRPI